MTKPYRNPLALDSRVRRDLELSVLSPEERKVGDYVLDNNPRSLEQIAAGTTLSLDIVREVMDTRDWYTNLRQQPRSLRLDPLIQEGYSEQEIAELARWKIDRVHQYIISWGLDEYHAQCMERRSREGPKPVKKKNSYLDDRKKHEHFDSSRVYKRGEIIFFPFSRMVGKIVKVLPKMIQVVFPNGEIREFRHGLLPDD